MDFIKLKIITICFMFLLFVMPFYTLRAGDFLSYPCTTCSGPGGTCLIGDGSLSCSSEIPADVQAVIEGGANAIGIDPFLLASIKYIENGWNLEGGAVSYASARGPFQFLSCTWDSWSVPGCEGFFETDPNKILQNGGLGRDGDGDGIADVDNAVDAALASATYLESLGANSDMLSAAAGYNGGGSCMPYGTCPDADIYADNVMSTYSRLVCN